MRLRGGTRSAGKLFRSRCPACIRWGVAPKESMHDPTQALLLYFIMPVWFLAGLADYLCHRATEIEHNAGPKESLIHLLMFGEFAVPILMCLFFECNARVRGVMISAFLAHEATALWDVSYAIERRYVSPLEQH